MIFRQSWKIARKRDTTGGELSTLSFAREYSYKWCAAAADAKVDCVTFLCQIAPDCDESLRMPKSHSPLPAGPSFPDCLNFGRLLKSPRHSLLSDSSRSSRSRKLFIFRKLHSSFIFHMARDFGHKTFLHFILRSVLYIYIYM